MSAPLDIEGDDGEVRGSPTEAASHVMQARPDSSSPSLSGRAEDSCLLQDNPIFSEFKDIFQKFMTAEELVAPEGAEGEEVRAVGSTGTLCGAPLGHAGRLAPRLAAAAAAAHSLPPLLLLCLTGRR